MKNVRLYYSVLRQRAVEVVAQTQVVVEEPTDMLAALLGRTCRDAEMHRSLERQRLEVIRRGDATIQEDVLGVVARKERQHLAEVSVVLFIEKQLRSVRPADDERGIHVRTSWCRNYSSRQQQKNSSTYLLP